MPLACKPLLGACKASQEAGGEQTFTEMVETWTRLAAEMEADQTLFQALSEMEFGEPYDALPNVLSAHRKGWVASRP
jgi:hypothetical protein